MYRILSQKNINIILKYVCVYSVFIISVLFSLKGGVLFKLLPDIGVIMMFFLYIWFNEPDSVYDAPINLFIFGIVIDTYTFMPIGLTSTSLLLSYKLVNIVRSFLITNDHIIYFIRDCIIFIFSLYTIKWFLFSYYKENFYLFRYIILNIIKDIFYCVLIYLLYKKFKENV